MKNKITYWLILSLLIVFQVNQRFCKLTKVRWTVIDFTSNEAIPFANVTFKNSTVGTITNTDGEYFLETRNTYDSIIVSFVGYKQQSYSVRKKQYQEINFLLEPSIFELEEIVVLPTENPAHPILRHIIGNKKNHNPRKFDSYTYKLYNKVEIDINNVDEEFRKQRLLRDFQFIFDYVDTSAITGKSYLPIFITESFSDYYFNKNPKTPSNKTSTIVYANVLMFKYPLFCPLAIPFSES